MRSNERTRVTALAPYPESGPSTRFRLAQFRDPLRERGIDLEIVPFVDAADYPKLFAAGAVLQKADLLRRGLKRRRRLLRHDRPDLWLVHRELAPLGSARLLNRLSRTGVPIAFDFDDAIYLDPVGGSRWLAPFRRPREHTADLCRRAALVLAGNPSLTDFAAEARGDRPGAHFLPTVIDTDRFRPASAPAGGPEMERLPLVGWIGTHTTARYLSAILPDLEALHARMPFRLKVVSNLELDAAPAGDLSIEFERWTPQREVAVTQELDVGLYPLEDTVWTRGKCGFKAVQYLACAVPVVASSVGVLPDVVPDGVAGALVGGDRSWAEALAPLLADPALRRRQGAAGRAHIVEHYSVNAVVDRMAAWMKAAARPAS